MDVRRLPPSPSEQYTSVDPFHRPIRERISEVIQERHNSVDDYPYDMERPPSPAQVPAPSPVYLVPPPQPNFASPVPVSSGIAHRQNATLPFGPPVGHPEDGFTRSGHRHRYQLTPAYPPFPPNLDHDMDLIRPKHNTNQMQCVLPTPPAHWVQITMPCPITVPHQHTLEDTLAQQYRNPLLRTEEYDRTRRSCSHNSTAGGDSQTSGTYAADQLHESRLERGRRSSSRRSSSAETIIIPRPFTETPRAQHRSRSRDQSRGRESRRRHHSSCDHSRQPSPHPIYPPSPLEGPRSPYPFPQSPQRNPPQPLVHTFVTVDVPFVPLPAQSYQARPTYDNVRDPLPNLDNIHSRPLSPRGSDRQRYEYRRPQRTFSTFSYFLLTFPVIAVTLQEIARCIYLYSLLNLPGLYRSRVNHIFEEVNKVSSSIRELALETAKQWKDYDVDLTKGFPLEPEFPQGIPVEMNPNLGLARLNKMKKLQVTWRQFIDSIIKEWKVFNVISALLVSAILTIASATTNPIVRYSALQSLICALMSLIYGCMYVFRFGTMRATHKAIAWAKEAENLKRQTAVFWNVWNFLAMPATWLGWSILWFIFCIISYAWNAETDSNSGSIVSSARFVLVSRIIVSTSLLFGLVYFIFIIITLRRYGEIMDKQWRSLVELYTDAEEKRRYPPFGASTGYYPQFHPPRTEYHPRWRQPYGVRE